MRKYRLGGYEVYQLRVSKNCEDIIELLRELERKKVLRFSVTETGVEGFGMYHISVEYPYHEGEVFSVNLGGFPALISKIEVGK